MKILSIIIPSYNTELYLERCLDSLLYDKSVYDLLEIIIVNDGSTDNTTKIAADYVKKYPSVVKLINKDNGGHGSTINAGIKNMSGKYFRIIDSDDWVNIIDFPKLVKKLKTETSDIVVTNYIRDSLYDEKEKKFTFTYKDDKKSQKLDSVNINKENFFFQFSMHSMTVKSELTKNKWEPLLEKTFYVDQEFVAQVLKNATNYMAYDLDIYRYFIGRPDQSMDIIGLFKHRSDHERVLKRLLNLYGDIKNRSCYKKILSKQITLMLGTHYQIYTSQAKISQNIKYEIIQFDKFLHKNFPDFRNQNPALEDFKKRFQIPYRISYPARSIVRRIK